MQRPNQISIFPDLGHSKLAAVVISGEVEVVVDVSGLELIDDHVGLDLQRVFDDLVVDRGMDVSTHLPAHRHDVDDRNPVVGRVGHPCD